MEVTNENALAEKKGLKQKFSAFFAQAPLIGLIISALVSVILEQIGGDALANLVGLPKIPTIFGFLIILKQPLLIPSAMVYVFIIYILPLIIIGRFMTPLMNALAARLFNAPRLISGAIYIGLLYLILHLWADISNYRLLTLKLTLIAIILTLSLNVINGYMGEFSCSHPGFMALGAYASSVVTLMFFVDGKIISEALLPAALAPYIFPFSLIFGGVCASVGALIIAIPSFRTRGDYLAIISLAFLFIVKSAIENLEFIGGPRGLSSQPDVANLPTVFLWTVICIWMINNFVRSILGKALNAVRDDEMAADAMTVNTRRVKLVAFMFSAFWAGVAGGLFAHVLRYINPATFGIQKLAEVLAMVYFGGLNSVYGSIVGAVSLSVLGEALRPLELFKWIIIPLMLILIMIYRPTGLIAFKEFNVREIIKPKLSPPKEV